MTASIPAIQALEAATAPEASPLGLSARGTGAFSQMLVDGVDSVNQKLNKADALVAAFAVDDTIPPHQVIFALERAHHALELMVQIRSRLVETYQEIMRMQI